jgi:eukaryotic-like serine/threonine-protein kinase
MAKRLPSEPPSLSGYSYIRPLGAGGFADVFLFEQDMPKRPVAAKVLLQDVVDDDLLRMFNAEADVMARLSSHPSILTVYEASVSADGRPYLVMEYCPSSLTNRYRREEMPVAEVLHIGVKIGSALETAHRAGLLHRDIKPSNILFTSFGAPVLSDFGIAAAVTGDGSEQELFAMSVPWSSPEVVDERVSGSIASEVWSLGATVYSLLAGRSPFEVPGAGQNARAQIRSRIQSAKYVPIGRPDVPQKLEQILARSMKKNPQDRQASALEFAYDLQTVQHEMGLTHTPLEVADDEWAAAGAPINFNDTSLRGPVRSTVADAPRRARKSGTSVTSRAAANDLPGLAEPSSRSSRTVSLRTAVLGGIGIAIVVAVVVVVIMKVLG